MPKWAVNRPNSIASTLVIPVTTLVIPAHDCMEEVRAGIAREAGLGHAGVRATQDAKAEAEIQSFEKLRIA